MGNDNEYGRFCPIAMGSEVIADRWTPLILREMCMGSTRFNDIIRGMPGISRSLLVRRLKHLERQGVLERWPSPTGKGSEYVLTPAGRDLEEVLHAIGRWAIDWFQESLDPTDIDAPTLMWWMHRYVTIDGDGPGRVVVQFDHTGPERLSIWIVCEDGSASVCRLHPGYDPDAVVTASTPALAEVFLGRRTWNDAVRRGDLVVAGPTRLTRSLHRWFPQNFFAPDVKRAMAATA